MAQSLEKQITDELARLRTYCSVASELECQRRTEIAHDTINELLDKLDDQHSQSTQSKVAHAR